MSVEDELRERLRGGIFSPYNWHSELTGDVVVNPDMILDAVIEFFKGRTLLIIDGKIMRVERADLGTSGRWLVRVAED